MAIKYADFDLATGNNDGTSWANAWKTMDDVNAGTNGSAPAAGDILVARGTDTLSSSPALTASGTAGNPIIYVGVNSSGVYEQGTRAVLDADNTAANALNFNSKEDIIFQAFDFLNGTSNNVVTVNKADIFFDCRIVSSGAVGCSAASKNYFIRCQFLTNTGSALTLGTDCYVSECFFNGNGGSDVQCVVPATTVTRSIFTNSQTCIWASTNLFVDGCIFNSADVICLRNGGTIMTVKNSLFTNNTVAGLSMFYQADVLAFNNAFWNNSGDKLAAGATYTIFPYGASDVALSGDPYDDESTDDLTITQPNTDLINIEVPLDPNNSAFECIGLPPTRSTGTVPTFAGITGSQMASNGSLFLQWTDGTGEGQYVVFLSTSAITYADSERVCLVNTGIEKCIVAQTGAGTPLLPNTLYYYAVRAASGTLTYDTNVVTGSYTCVGLGNTAPQYIKNIAGG